MGPSARVSREQRAGTAGGGAGRDHSLSLCITGLPQPQQGLARKVQLIKEVLSCFTHLEGLYFLLEFFPPWKLDGRGSREQTRCWHEDVSPCHGVMP